MCIKLHGVERTRLAVDPFMVLGTTAVAALRLGIPCIGFEIDQAYLDVACARLTRSMERETGAQLRLTDIDAS